MATMHIYLPGKPVETRPCPDVIEHLDLFHEWLPKGYVEHVTVLFKGKRAHMFVHESGRLVGLPLNHDATEIYRAASLARDIEPNENAIIVGPAIVLEGATLS